MIEERTAVNWREQQARVVRLLDDAAPLVPRTLAQLHEDWESERLDPPGAAGVVCPMTWPG